MNIATTDLKGLHKPHWSWHLLFVGAGLLILAALLSGSNFVVQWMDAGDSLSTFSRYQLVLARIGFIAMALICLMLWVLRQRLTRNWHSLYQRLSIIPPNLALKDLVPNLPFRAHIFLWVLLVLWIAISMIALHMRSAFLVPLTKENGIIETGTVFFYLFSGILALNTVLRLSRQTSNSKIQRWWLLAMMAGFFFVALEETDWGQNYFHYATPEFFNILNIQEDVNIHNLAIPGTGIINWRWANALHWLLTGLLGSLLPLLLVLSQRFRHWAWVLEMPLPPWIVQAACFFSFAVIPLDMEMIGQFEINNIPSELREFTVSAATAVWIWAVRKNRAQYGAGS